MVVDKTILAHSEFFNTLFELSPPDLPIIIPRDLGLFKQIINFAQDPHSCMLLLDPLTRPTVVREMDFYAIATPKHMTLLLDLCDIIHRRDELLGKIAKNVPKRKRFIRRTVKLDTTGFTTDFSTTLARRDIPSHYLKALTSLLLMQATMHYEAWLKSDSLDDLHILYTWLKAPSDLGKLTDMLYRKDTLVERIKQAVPAYLDFTGINDLCQGRVIPLYNCDVAYIIESTLCNACELLDAWSQTRCDNDFRDLREWMQHPECMADELLNRMIANEDL